MKTTRPPLDLTKRIESVSPDTVYVSFVAPGITEGVDKCGAAMAGLTPYRQAIDVPAGAR